MGKMYLHTVAMVCFFWFLSSSAIASNLDVFLDKCGACHKQGAAAKPVNPASKAGVVWAKYFNRGRHPEDIKATISAQEMKKIIVFLQNHAADSDHPVAAIIPK